MGLYLGGEYVNLGKLGENRGRGEMGKQVGFRQIRGGGDYNASSLYILDSQK